MGPAWSFLISVVQRGSLGHLSARDTHMAQTMRFGRRVPLPSTRQIIHELKVYGLEEDLRKARAAEAEAAKPATSDAGGGGDPAKPPVGA